MKIDYDKELRILKVACSRCEGRGKVELKSFNPVIRRGAVLR